MQTKPARKLSLACIVASICAVALTACGSSSGKKPAAKSSGGTLIAFSKCMRDHGVTSFPDPSAGGGGLNISGTGINPDSPSFKAAQATCFKLMPGGGPGGKASAQAIKRATGTAECMRNHGVTGFPDPVVTSSPPDINPANYSAAEYGNGIFIGIPKSINVNSPAFKKAAATCNFR